jgi:hypothetical protein
LTWTLLLACNEPREVHPVPSGGRRMPAVEEATARCEETGQGLEVTVRVRLDGWASDGRWELWDGVARVGGGAFATLGFDASLNHSGDTRQSCDFLGNEVGVTLPGDRCEGLTWLVGVKNEQGCVVDGCVAWWEEPGDTGNGLVLDQEGLELSGCQVSRSACRWGNTAPAAVVHHPADDAEGCP